MTSIEVQVCEKPFSEKLQAYLAENPSAYDITFSVGPTKEKVSAVKLILVAASPVFRKLFEENWDMAVVRNNEGIPLPDIDAPAFKIFLQLLPSEHVSIEELKKLKLPADQILSLVSISKQFGMPTMQTVFEELSQPFFKQFGTYACTLDFLKLSSKNLATILASDLVLLKEIDIFQFVCRWAEHQFLILDLVTKLEKLSMEKSSMEKSSMEKSTKEKSSMREVLGESLKEIRFPVMTFQEFGRVVCPREILTADETLKIFKYIALAENERNVYDEALLGFKTIPRIKPEIPAISDTLTESSNSQRSVLEFFESAQVVKTPLNVCDEYYSSYLYFNLDKKIELLGIGFAGPAHSSGEYDVSVELNVFMNGYSFSCGSQQQIIEAKKCEKFHFYFDNPIMCNPGPNPKFFAHLINFTLKGPQIQSIDVLKRKNKTDIVSIRKTQDEVAFVVRMGGSKVVELLFRKLE